MDSLKDMSIGIVGAGTMGRGIAQVSAMAGLKTIICDLNEKSLTDAKTAITKILSRLVEKEKISEEKKEAVLSCLQFSTDIQSLKDSHLVIEAIVENLEIKRQLFKDLDLIVSKDCILATNTSSLSVTELATQTKYPQRVAGLHFFNPVPLMKVVEVIKGVFTDDNVIATLKSWTQFIGHQAAVAIDSPGFIVNHAGRGYGTEAFRILGEQIASAHDIDHILKDTGEFPMGPFALADLVGLDISQKVMESVYHQYYEEPRFRPSPIARTRVAAGLLGRKTGQGFYDYKNSVSATDKNTLEVLDHESLSVWIGAENDSSKEQIKKLIQPSVNIEEGRRPSDKALCVVAPLGLDASSEAKRLGLNPSRTFAIDTFTELHKKITLMATPLCSKKDCEQLISALSSDERQVILIDDSPGFISQRVIACIVNVGCEIVQQGITSTEELDQAVQLGLGYKLGPLALGDKYGAQNILTILDELYKFYGDPRYRASPWLKRRALLEMPLTQKAIYKQ